MLTHSQQQVKSRSHKQHLVVQRTPEYSEKKMESKAPKISEQLGSSTQPIPVSPSGSEHVSTNDKHSQDMSQQRADDGAGPSGGKRSSQRPQNLVYLGGRLPMPPAAVPGAAKLRRKMPKRQQPPKTATNEYYYTISERNQMLIDEKMRGKSAREVSGSLPSSGHFEQRSLYSALTLPSCLGEWRAPESFNVFHKTLLNSLKEEGRTECPYEFEEDEELIIFHFTKENFGAEVMNDERCAEGMLKRTDELVTNAGPALMSLTKRVFDGWMENKFNEIMEEDLDANPDKNEEKRIRRAIKEIDELVERRKKMAEQEEAAAAVEQDKEKQQAEEPHDDQDMEEAE